MFALLEQSTEMKKQTPSSSSWGVALLLVLLVFSAVLSEGSGDHVSFPHPLYQGRG